MMNLLACQIVLPLGSLSGLVVWLVTCILLVLGFWMSINFRTLRIHDGPSLQIILLVWLWLVLGLVGSMIYAITILQWTGYCWCDMNYVRIWIRHAIISVVFLLALLCGFDIWCWMCEMECRSWNVLTKCRLVYALCLDCKIILFHVHKPTTYFSDPRIKWIG